MRRWSGRLRGSVLLLGPLLARRGRARLAPPGGDFPARRTIAHPSRGAGGDGRAHHRRARRIISRRRTASSRRRCICTKRRSPAPRRRCSPLRPRRASPRFAHAACEPHVVELCEFLKKMGAGVTGAGTSTIRIEGPVTPARRRAHAVGRLHRGRQLGRGRGGHGRRDRRPRRARRGHRGRRRGSEADEHRVPDGWRRLPRRAVDARRPPAASRPDCGPDFRATS